MPVGRGREPRTTAPPRPPDRERGRSIRIGAPAATAEPTSTMPSDDRGAEVGLQHEQHGQHAKTGSTGTSRSSVVQQRSGAASTCAPHSASASLATSEGCSCERPEVEPVPGAVDAQRRCRAPAPDQQHHDADQQRSASQRRQLRRREPQRDPEQHEPERAQITCWTNTEYDAARRQRSLDRSRRRSTMTRPRRAAARARRGPGAARSAAGRARPVSGSAAQLRRGAGRAAAVRRTSRGAAPGRPRHRRSPAALRPRAPAGPAGAPAAPPPARWPADVGRHRSARTAVGERVAAVGVVAEHVHRAAAGASSTVSPGRASPAAARRPRHRRLGRHTSPRPSRHRRRWRPSTTGTVGACRASAAAITRPVARPAAPTPASRPATAATSSSTSAPLSSPPAIQTTARVGGQRGAGGVRVGGLAVVDVARRPPTVADQHVAVRAGPERRQPAPTAAAGTPRRGPARRRPARWRRCAGRPGGRRERRPAPAAARRPARRERAVDQHAVDDAELARAGRAEGERDRAAPARAASSAAATGSSALATATGARRRSRALASR